MSEDASISTDEILAIIILCLTLCVISFAAGHGMSRRSIQQEAVSANAAHYEADKDGNVKFIWNSK